jgi:acyl dehydratase
MARTEFDSPNELREVVGTEVAVTDWLEVTQQQIDQFADATGDHQWIHVDAERARRESPYGTTIAHGFLTVSLLSCLMAQAVVIRGLRLAVNYGLNRVRFPAAVPVDSLIRAHITLQSLDEIPGGLHAVWEITVEREGSDKPVCAAEWLLRYYV